MTRRMANMTFIEAVSALMLLTKAGSEDPYASDIDERPFASRKGANQRHIALVGSRMYDVRITNYDGHHNVWSDPYSPRVEDVLASDWELWEAKDEAGKHV